MRLLNKKAENKDKPEEEKVKYRRTTFQQA